jgi:hypothetical protein
MANRFPLIIDTADGNRIKELPNGDSLNLTGNAIVGVSNISATGALSVASIAVEGSVVAGSNVIATANMQAADFLISGVSILNSIDYEDLLNKPTFADVAISGDYNDLINTPILNLAAVATSGDYNDLINTPVLNLAAVATTGNYSDLNNIPVFAAVATSGSYVDLTNTPAIPTDVSDLTDNTGIISGGAFTDLSDTPDVYTGEAGKFLVVNEGETGLGFTTVSTTITDTQIITALGYTPYNGDTNPSGYINDDVGIITALGYTPYNGTTNPNGYLTTVTDTAVISALGFTPYADNNPDGFINDSAGVVSALGYTPYNGDTNPSGYLTAEADTLESVTGRGASSSVTITAAGFTTTGNVSTTNLTVSADINFTSTGTISLDGGAGSTVVVGGTSNISLRDASGNIDVQAALIPNIGTNYDIGSAGNPWANAHFGSVVNAGDFATTAASSSFSLQGSLSITPGAATNFVRVTTGVFGVPSITTTARNALTPQYGDIIHNTTDGITQTYVRAARDIGTDGWVNLTIPFLGAPPASPYNGQMAIAVAPWDPAGSGTQTFVIYLEGAWVVLASG